MAPNRWQISADTVAVCPAVGLGFIGANCREFFEVVLTSLDLMGLAEFYGVC